MKLSQDRLCGWINTLGASCGVLLSFYMAISSLNSDPGSVVFSLFMVLLCGIGGCIVLHIRPLFRKTEYTLWAMALLGVGLFLRLSLFDHISGDYVSFLSIWTETMAGMTIREALSTPIGDYNMPYLYVILLISRLPFYDLYCIKLFSVFFDVAAALAVGYLVKMLSKKELPTLLAFAAALFAPTTWLNSGYWGQCDSVYGALALWGVYWGLSNRPKCSMVLLALSLSFKLQAVFVLPIVAFFLVTERVSLRQLLLFPVGFLGAMVPALLGGRSVQDTFSIYVDQTGAYPYLSLNAPSFWSLIPNDYFYELAAAPVLLAMVLTLMVLFLFLRKYPVLNAKYLLELALIFSLMIPWSLPKMHERYFYLAEMLSIVYVCLYPRRLPVGVGLLLGGLMIYSAYLFGGVPVISMGGVALVYGAVLLYLVYTLYLRVKQSEKQILKGDHPYGN